MERLSLVREISAARKPLPEHPGSAYEIHIIVKNAMHPRQKVSGHENKSILIKTYLVSASEWSASVSFC